MKTKKIIIPALISSMLLSGNLANIYANEVTKENLSSSSTQADTSVKKEYPIPFTLEEYKQKSGLELAELLRSKKVTSEELVNLAYEVISEENPKLNAVITTRKDEALQEAREFDTRNSQPETVFSKEEKPFAGVPILLKGLTHVYKGSDDSNGTLLYKGKISKYDSSVAKAMKSLGFIILGQTNFPEYGFRNITDSKLFGITNNVWDNLRNSGGSSGGSASAVASGMTPIASGSDMGGSIRIPSGWSGLIGLKTSRGMTDNGKKDGTNIAVAFPITKTIADTEVLLDKLSTKKDDLIHVDDIKTLKIAYSTKSPLGTEVSEEAKQAVLESVEFLRSQGFSVEEVEPPIDGREAARDYTYGALGSPLGLINLPKALEKANLAKEDLDPLTWAFSITKTKDVDIKINFQENLKKYKDTMEKFHKNYPIFITPTNAVPAPLNTDDYVTEKDKKDLYNIQNLPKNEKFNLLLRQWEPMIKKSPFTSIANLTGEPSLSLPTYLSKDGLPMGILLNGVWGMDATLLKFGKLFEDNNKFKIYPTIHNKLNKAQVGNKLDVNYYGTTFEYSTGTSITSDKPSLNIETVSEKTNLDSSTKRKENISNLHTNSTNKEEVKITEKETKNTYQKKQIEKTILPKTGLNEKNTIFIEILLLGLATLSILKRKKSN